MAKVGKVEGDMHIPDDTLMSILSEFPVKKVLSFRFVSKNWLKVIRNPDFVRLHFNHHRRINNPDKPILLMRKLKSGNRVLTLIPDDNKTVRRDIDIGLLSPSIGSRDESITVLMGPCYGIFCISDSLEAVLFNPATMQRRIIPLPVLGPEATAWDHRMDDVSDNFATVSFGYDDVSKDFKLVRFTSSVDKDDDVSGYRFRVYIYCLSTGIWRDVFVSMPPSDINEIMTSTLFFNNGFHWLGNGDTSWSIIAFDLNKESISILDLPDSEILSEYDIASYSLSVFNGYLALVCQITEPVNGFESSDEDAFVVWVMTDYGLKDSWVKLHYFTDGDEFESLLSFSGEEELLAQNYDGQLVSFNLNTRQANYFQVHGITESMYAFRYQESLVSLS